MSRTQTTFLNYDTQLRGTIIKGTLLLAMDITSLYTNIPNDKKIEAAMRALESNRPGRVKPTNLTIIKMLKMVLKKKINSTVIITCKWGAQL